VRREFQAQFCEKLWLKCPCLLDNFLKKIAKMKLNIMKKVLVVTIVCVLNQIGIAQLNSNSTFPSANNSFLGKIGITSAETMADVNLYTGSLVLNVPICVLPSKDLNIPVSLNYTGGRGIKIQDYASFVGLGWQLNAGGGISRVVRGYPDEQPNGYLGTSLSGQQISTIIANNGTIPSNFTSSPTQPQPPLDGEPDLFSVKTPFFDFQFVFDASGNPVFSNSTGLKIIPLNFYNSSNYQNSSFKVLDASGNQFYFGTTSNSVEKMSTTIYGNTSITYFPTTWYLDKIVTFNGKDVVTLTYQQASNNDDMYHYQKTRYYFNSNSIQFDETPSKNTIINPKYISSITSKQGEVNFSYAFDRGDAPNAARLTSILINAYNPQTQGITIANKVFKFNYSYFGTLNDPVNTSRLRLDKIIMEGGTTAATGIPAPITFKSFAYNTVVDLPSRQSQNFDYWGYYSPLQNPAVTATSDPLLAPALRLPDLTYTSSSVLKSISDISGGTWNMSYELNDYYKASTNSNVKVGGLRIKNITRTIPSGESLQTDYIYNNSSGNSTGQILTESYNNLIFYISSPYYLYEQINFSESPSMIYDNNGAFSGYSSVKVLQQNGGYTITNFTNFSNFPDILNTYSLNPYTTSTLTAPLVTTSIGYAYKRGLPINEIVYITSGDKISEINYQYTSLTTPVTTSSYAYHPFYITAYDYLSRPCFYNFSSKYWNNIENYRLSQTISKEYDQKNQANYIQTMSTYIYAANKRLIKSINSIDSKGSNFSKTFYYTEDMDQSGNGIPMLTGIDQTAINNMVTMNNANALIHEINTKNSATAQVHNTYTAFPVGSTNNIYLTTTSGYNGNTLTRQQNFNYDLANSNLLSTNETNGKVSSFLYGYNSTVPVAKVINASSSSATSTQATTTYGGYINLPNTVTFTTTAAGNIVLQIGFGSYPGSTNLTNVYYTLTGPASSSGTLCFSMTGSGCSPYSSSITLPSMPAGTYTLSANVSTNFPSSNPNVSYSYTTLTPIFTYSKEFFYEGFEQGNATNINGAHTGNGYYSGSYSVNFPLPNSRSYVMQWWSLISGAWVIQEQPYTGPVTLTGNIDDIRVFPSDALMETFTFNPLVGKTGETDASGRSTTYEYDGLSRPNITRDNDKNIISKTCYNYAGQSVGCSLFSNSAQSGVFTKNNCPTGTGTTSTYVVNAGKYFSDISQADADQQAINDADNNGQNYANTNGTCSSLISVIARNWKSNAYAITFTNAYNSSQSYTFSVSGNQTQTNNTVGQIPFGTYNVTIYPLYNTSTSYSCTVNSYYQSGVGTKNFYSVSCNCATCASIQIF
jgi:YD repeat-containing protein